MSTTTFYDYKYAIDGRNMAILQRQRDLFYSPYIDYGGDYYVTPTAADTGGILVKYTVTINAPADEVTDIGVDRHLAQALVHYVKAKMTEDSDPRMSQLNMNKFYKLVQQNQHNKQGTRSRITANFLGAIK